MNKILRISIVVVICLIVILGVALLIGQCSKKDVEDTTTTTTPTTTAPTTSSTTQPTTPPVDPECTEHVDADTNYVCDICGDELERPIESTYVETNDKVYVISTVLNLRKNPNETGVATVAAHMDEELTRLGYYTSGANNGWSKVVYDGQEYYVLTECITTQKPITEFAGEAERVYLVRNEKVYSKASLITAYQYSEAMDTLFAGTEIVVTRLGVATTTFKNADGTEITFAKIQYTTNGVEVVRYIDNSALTTEAPVNPDGAVTFEANTDVLKVIAEESIWLRKSTFYGGEYTESEKAKAVPTGTILQATHKGIESDGTVWYKVIFEGETYYVIYKSSRFEIQTPTAQ